MKIGITFEFLQYVLPTKRHRKPRYRKMVTCSDIQVNGISEKEFPLVLRTHTYSSLVRGARTYEEVRDGESTFELVTDDYRLYNGNLYKAERISYGSVVSDAYIDPYERLRNCMEYAARNAFSYPHDMEEFAYNGVEPVVIGDNRAEVEKAMQEKADSMLIFDNKSWSIVDEPVYEIITFGLGHNHGGTGFFVSNGYNPNISAKNYFNALQRDEAIAYADETARRRGDTKDVGKFADGEWIEVIRPEAVRANPASDHASGGNPILETLYGITENASSSAEAGLLAMACAAAM